MKSLTTLMAVALAASSAQADVKPHILFSENAVLQQQMNVPVWGTANDGEQVTVEIQNQKVTTTAANGAWKVVLKPLTVGGPFTLKITGANNSVTFTNIAVGEVWVCSGQSNMASGLNDVEGGPEEKEKANDPSLRILVVPIARSEKVERDFAVEALWRPIVGSYNANLCGAVPYYLGRDLRKARNVPVGIIQCVWGGSIAEAWIPRSYLEADPAFKPIFERYPRILKQYELSLAHYRLALKRVPEEEAKAKAAGTTLDTYPAPPADPAKNGKVQRDRPYGIYNAMLAPLQPVGIRGAAWYQGESSAGRDIEYRLLLQTMIRAWRETWGLGDFPFLIVQLPAYGTIVNEPRQSELAELREGQLLTSQQVPNTATVITIDCGDEKNTTNLHPPRKEPIGIRLCLAARAIAYKEKVEYSGPVYSSMKIDSKKPDRVVLSFTHLGGGLVAKDGPLKDFTIAGEDRKFVNAQAEIQGDHVVVWSPQVAKPVAVRYAWADYPTGNLWNREGMPASPFRTDDFAVTHRKGTDSAKP